MFYLNTDRAQDWAYKNIFSDLFWGDSVPVENRYVMDLIYGMFTDGLQIEIDGQILEEMTPA